MRQRQLGDNGKITFSHFWNNHYWGFHASTFSHFPNYHIIEDFTFSQLIQVQQCQHGTNGRITLSHFWAIIFMRISRFHNSYKYDNGIGAIISKTSGTDAVFAEITIPRMRFHQVLKLWTCFPCMFDMSTMLKLCWNWFWAFGAVSYGRFLKLLP